MSLCIVDEDANAPTKVPLTSGGNRHRLVLVWGDSTLSQEIPERGTWLVGRGEEATLRVNHHSVSRLHARLVASDGALTLEDLGSSNGTFIAGRRVAKGVETRLPEGALVEIGTALLLVQGPAPPALAPLAVGSSPSPDAVMAQVYEVLDVAAASKLSVLLLGETGVGKEVLAAHVHTRSPRAAGPFVKVNGAALTESLLEAEFFGYERGAFTGATQSKAGLLESASGGTLFLDELGEMPLTTQAKLLRVLESGEVLRVGSSRPVRIDVRFVAATNRDLQAAIAAGRFRADLYFRLEGVTVRVPPLRDRPKDIVHLAQRFALSAALEQDKPPPQLTDAVLAMLVRHPWPGNVRELKNLVTRAVLFSRSGRIDAADLSFETVVSPLEAPTTALGGPYAPSAISPDTTLPVVSSGSATLPPPAVSSEGARILDALEKCAGNQTRAAKMVGLSRAQLISRLNAMGVPRPRRR
jgi:DNA-binding NtrC family response regulator